MTITREGTKAGADAVAAWKLVPTIATSEMLSSGKHYMKLALRDGLDRLDRQRVGYEAMLAAAPTPPPAEGVVGAEEASDRMIRIGALIEELSGIRDRYGNTCVYIRRGGLSWGAVAMNRKADDEEHGVFNLQEQHDRDMAARLGQIQRLMDDRDECRQRLEAAEAELASIKAVPAQGDEVARLRKALAEARSGILEMAHARGSEVEATDAELVGYIDAALATPTTEEG